MTNLTYILTTSFATVLMIVLTLRSISTKGEKRPSLSWLLGLIALWTFGASIENMSARFGLGQQVLLFWTNFQYPAIALLPTIWLAFVCTHTGFFMGVKRQPFFIIPSLSVLMAWTNSFHGLMWPTITLSDGAFPGLEVSHGFWFNYIHTPYNYGLILLSLFVISRFALYRQHAIRGQMMILAAAVLIPVGVNLAYLTGFLPSVADPTPVAFAMSGFILMFGLFRYQLFDREPITYRTVFDNLKEAVLILDEDYRIIDINAEAAQILGHAPGYLLGQNVQNFIDISEQTTPDMAKKNTWVEKPLGNNFVEIHLNPFDEKRKGHVLTIHNVTKRRKAESELGLQLDKLNALVDIADALRDINSPDAIYNETLKVMFSRTRANFCAMLQLNEGHLEVIACDQQDQDVSHLIGKRLTPQLGPSWRVVETGQTFQVRDIRGLNSVFTGAETLPTDFVGTPCKNESGNIIGILVATLTTPGERFDESDKAFLEAISHACSGALGRLERLTKAQTTAQEYQQLYTSAERQARELALLDRVRNAVARQLNLSEVMRATVEAVNEEFDCALVSLYMLEGKQLMLQHQRGYRMIPSHIPMNQGVIGRVVRTGQAILLSEPQSYPGFIRSVDGVTSEVAVPIFDHGKVVGALNLETTQTVKLGQADLKLMMALSEQISIAVERARLYGEVRENEERFRLLAENMSDLICLHDLRGRTVYISPSAEAILGYAPGSLLGKAPSKLFHPEDRHVYRQMMIRLATGERVKPVSYRARHASGEYVWLESFVQSVTNDEGVTHYVSGSRDITERKKMQEQLLEGALLYDALTQLPNRVLFSDRLQQALKRGERDGTPFALLFLDLDRFKIVNDSLGHNVGDKLLTETSRRIQTCVRPQDTVARLGGDEFAVILEGVGEERASEVASCIQEILKKPYMLEGHSVTTSASIGITLGGDFVSSDPEQLLRNADLAMYHAKASGKAQHAVFDKSMHQRIKDLMQLEQDLRRALEEEELFVVYQPVVDLQSCAVTGFEALVRWQHPTRGIIEPTRFIAVAEEMGLITQIDQWVLSKAARQVSEWTRRYRPQAPLTLSVNLSTKNFLLDDLVERIQNKLSASGLAASQLKLEITESVLMDNVEVGSNLLNELRALGIGMQIDDFGTGYSSLSYLHTLPLDSLKIDRSFVEQLLVQDGAIVKTIIALANSLSLDIIAEGIETSAQLELLSQLGCTYGQGYYMAKPLVPADVECMFNSGGVLGVLSASAPIEGLEGAAA